MSFVRDASDPVRYRFYNFISTLLEVEDEERLRWIGNPFHVGLSGGIGGDTPWRPQDGFGVGFYWTKVSEISSTISLDNEYGFEAFYRIGVTPWLHLTLDVQTLHAAADLTDADVLLGVRTRWRF